MGALLNKRTTIAATLICVLLIALLSTSAIANSQSDGVLRLGTISSKPKKHIKHGTPLVNYLVDKLSAYGITTGEVVVANDIEQMALWLRTGQVDLVSETVFAALQLKEKANAQFLVRRWKKNVGEYSSVFITARNSGIASLKDLAGKKIVFEDRSSTSGYYIPAAMLIEEGMALQPISSPSSPVPADKVGVLFANEQLNASSEINITAWVFQGQADVGAFSDLDWSSPKSAPPKMKEKLHVFHESPPFPRAVMVIRESLPTTTKDAIKELLIAAENDEFGKQALKTYQKTKRFDALDDTAWQAIARADKLRRIVEAEL